MIYYIIVKNICYMKHEKDIIYIHREIQISHTHAWLSLRTPKKNIHPRKEMAGSQHLVVGVDISPLYIYISIYLSIYPCVRVKHRKKILS